MSIVGATFQDNAKFDSGFTVPNICAMDPTGCR